MSVIYVTGVSASGKSCEMGRNQADGYTIIEHVAVMDPRGYIPNWIVNLVQTNVPFNMIWNLRLQVVRPDIVVRQEVLDQMK